MPKTVTVELTLTDVLVLRNLIVKEAARLEYSKYQHRKDEPSALRRIHPVARKMLKARKAFDDGAR